MIPQNEAFQNECRKIRDDLEKKRKLLEEKYLSRDASFLKGKYVGRIGRITQVILQDDVPKFLVQPYSKIDGSLLFQNRFARSFWSATQIVIH